MMKHLASRSLGFLLAGCIGTAGASDLSYTFLDFLVINSSVDAAGVQTPVPNQVVSVSAGSGDGIAVAGGIALPSRLYLSGRFATSVIDIDGVVTSPLTTAQVSGEFDLLTSALAVGYVYPLGATLDLIGELSYDSTEYDFGSFAGEELDIDDSGLGLRAGMRWNPNPSLEVFTFLKHTPVGEPVLEERALGSELRANAGVRWYVFEDLGVGLDYESGSAAAWTLSMRFSFGNLPW